MVSPRLLVGTYNPPWFPTGTDADRRPGGLSRHPPRSWRNEVASEAAGHPEPSTKTSLLSQLRIQPQVLIRTPGGDTRLCVSRETPGGLLYGPNWQGPQRPCPGLNPAGPHVCPRVHTCGLRGERTAQRATLFPSVSLGSSWRRLDQSPSCKWSETVITEAGRSTLRAPNSRGSCHLLNVLVSQTLLL